MNDESSSPPDEVPPGHSYDGIQEYDNPTPMWWNLLFIGTILFAPIYAIWFHSPYAQRTHADRYTEALAVNMKKQFGELGTLTPDQDTILRYMGDPEWSSVGSATFATNCAQCHGKQGQGISGVNLTDNYYKNVKQVTDIVKVIEEGANAGAMPAWKNRLHPNEVVLIASYVAAMRGQNVAGGRGPEGQEIPPWPDPPAANQSPTTTPAPQASDKPAE